MADGARKRALRAARVVTLGLVLATPGCYGQHARSEARDAGGGRDAALADADLADAGLVDAALADAGLADAGAPIIEDAAVADAGVCVMGGDPEAYIACCDAIGWDWNRGCAAWGPFVPPGEVA